MCTCDYQLDEKSQHKYMEKLFLEQLFKVQAMYKSIEDLKSEVARLKRENKKLATKAK